MRIRARGKGGHQENKVVLSPSCCVLCAKKVQGALKHYNLVKHEVEATHRKFKHCEKSRD